MNNKTILYYTSNRESLEFEAKVRADIFKRKGDLPIISVSQKPIDFGENICVGEVGHSYINMFRQILIGARKATTQYLVMTEADTIYPENYFSFEPAGANSYRYNNVWIVFKEKIYSYRRKVHFPGAQIIKREYVIKLTQDYLDGGPEWYNGWITNKDKNGKYKKDVFNSIPFELFGNENACISFKTGDAMRRGTDVMHGRENIKTKLPYWGHIRDIRRKYLNQ
jgi:hypothetical protein